MFEHITNKKSMKNAKSDAFMYFSLKDTKHGVL